MGINLNVLSAISGAAEQYTKQTSELKKELRENKRRQRDWLATYGSKALNENKQQQESVQSALDDLKARGLEIPDAIQLLQKHGVGSVLELSKYVKEYEVANNTKVDKDLMDKLWTAADDFTTTETTFEAAVAKVFGTSAGAATAPVIQEAEDRNFFEQLKYNMGERYDDELEDFLTDASEGIGGKSIRELRAMSASSPSMLGTEGSAVFDRSALRGSESTSAERASWNDLKETILYNALESLDPSVAESIRLTPADTETGFVSRNSDEQWNILTSMNAPEAYKEAIAEATRNAAQGIDLGSNRAAWNSYGGQDALNAILNSESAATIAQREKEEKLKEDLKAANYTEETKPSEVASAVEAQEYFNNNPEANHVILNDELISRDSNDTTDTPPITEEPEYDSSFQLTVQPSEASIEARPSEFIGEIVTEEDFEKASTVEDDQSAWDEKYDGKYRKDGTAILVAIRSTLSSEQQRQWDIFYEETHDPETGKPLTSGSQ